jgi:hypothetical protein
VLAAMLVPVGIAYAVASGLPVCILAGIARPGFVTELLSKPIRNWPCNRTRHHRVPVRRLAHFFPTVGAAVSSYLEINDVAWEDWEDQAKR